MTLAITKKKIAVALGLTLAVVAVAEVLVLRASLHIFAAQDAQGCACAGQASITGGQWTILGFGALFIAGWIFGGGAYLHTLIRTKKMLRVLNGAAVLKDGLVLFNGGVCEAFTFGFFKPRIAICAHCNETLPQEELQAMLTHEKAHALARDPLWFLLFDVARAAFFFVPMIRQFTQWFRTASELSADDYVGNRKALGGALLRTVDGIQGASRTPLAISSFASQIEERIERLINPAWYAQRRIHWASMLVSIVIIFGSMGSLYGSSYRAVEERFECVRQTEYSPCRHSFDGTVHQYYNGVSKISHSL